MKRRDAIRAGAAVAGLAALGGCTEYHLQEAGREPPPVESIREEEFDLPVSQRLALAEEGIERAAGAEIRDPDEFAARLEAQDIHVEKLEGTVVKGTALLELEYVVEETLEEGLMHHLGVVAGGYAALIEAGDERKKLDVHLLATDGEEFGEYEIRRHWAERYNEDEYTARKYADEIAVTVAST